MSFTSVISAPMKYFQKKVITFLIIHRHDLQEFNEVLRYVSIKPKASISVLRHKIWHLLELPDFCDELIVLKTSCGEEIPLTALHKGNDSKNPFLLEVWPPRRSVNISELALPSDSTATFLIEPQTLMVRSRAWDEDETSIRYPGGYDDKKTMHYVFPVKKSEPTTIPSTSSIFSRLNRKRSRDSLSNLLLKIQADLSLLNTKVSGLENKIVSSYLSEDFLRDKSGLIKAGHEILSALEDYEYEDDHWQRWCTILPPPVNNNCPTAKDSGDENQVSVNIVLRKNLLHTTC